MWFNINEPLKRAKMYITITEISKAARAVIRHVSLESSQTVGASPP
jgi:hypothetical protein